MAAASTHHDGNADLAAWGRSVLEEVLFRAGLDARGGEVPDAVSTSLSFAVRADGPGRALELSFDRVGATAVRLLIPLEG
ncbi:MAG: hypothetical protein GC201_18300 [Alphaproteobacteria bacterium]|nr:hypothetical protein [Alphaproteobacteria bacterium]